MLCLGHFQNINNISLLNPTLINNPGIYNLLTVKYQKAKVENVDIQLEFFFDLKQLRMPVYDFSRMFGIFLDNAIEASALSKEKIVSTYIPLPPNAEQIRIIKTIHQLFDQLDIITESL